MTNLEWLRTLDAKEMADFKLKSNDCDWCKYGKDTECDGNCIKNLTEWFETEHKEKLEPCPFCKSDNVDTVEIYESAFNVKTWRVKCSDCGSMTGKKETKEQAINIWNRRK